MKKFLIIDGNSLFYRAYHALPPLSDKTGLNANAVFGFSNMLLKAISEVKPEYIACAFDTAAPTFRHIEFEQYKAQRPEPPSDLYPQLPKLKKVLDAFGISYFEIDGFEADDVIGTLATKAIEGDVEAVILTGDRDALQLVDGKIKVQMPGWNINQVTLFGAKEVEEKYGVTPLQFVDYKSLIGDSSDNIPGISGIGPKTAATLLQTYDNLENLFEHLDEIPEKVRVKLEAGKDLALAAKSLVKLDCDVDLGFKINDLKFDPDWDIVRKEYEDLGFKSIAAKVGGGKVEEVGSEVEEKAKKKDKDKSNQLELI